LPASHATIFAVVNLADMADRVAAIVSSKPCGVTPARLFACVPSTIDSLGVKVFYPA
jgi:hypothetical protein